MIRARHGRITHCLCHLWFTDGFDTRDSNEAKALLEELAILPIGRDARQDGQNENPLQDLGPLGG
jgi:hypothetical protein